MVMMRIVCEWSDEDCMKVDEDKLLICLLLSPSLGQLRSFGKLRFPSESADYYYLTLFVYVLRLVCFPFGLAYCFLFRMFVLECVCVVIPCDAHHSRVSLSM